MNFLSTLLQRKPLIQRRHFGGGACRLTTSQNGQHLSRRLRVFSQQVQLLNVFFSMLKGLYDDTQSCVLEDHQASALMVHYKKVSVERKLPECCLKDERRL